MQPGASHHLAHRWGASDVEDQNAIRAIRAGMALTPLMALDVLKASSTRSWMMAQEGIDAESDILRLIVAGAFDENTSVLYKGSVLSMPQPFASPADYRAQLATIQHTSGMWIDPLELGRAALVAQDPLATSSLPLFSTSGAANPRMGKIISACGFHAVRSRVVAAPGMAPVRSVEEDVAATTAAEGHPSRDGLSTLPAVRALASAIGASGLASSFPGPAAPPFDVALAADGNWYARPRAAHLPRDPLFSSGGATTATRDSASAPEAVAAPPPGAPGSSGPVSFGDEPFDVLAAARFLRAIRTGADAFVDFSAESGPEDFASAEGIAKSVIAHITGAINSGAWVPDEPANMRHLLEEAGIPSHWLGLIRSSIRSKGPRAMLKGMMASEVVADLAEQAARHAVWTGVQILRRELPGFSDVGNEAARAEAVAAAQQSGCPVWVPARGRQIPMYGASSELDGSLERVNVTLAGKEPTDPAVWPQKDSLGGFSSVLAREAGAEDGEEDLSAFGLGHDYDSLLNTPSGSASRDTHVQGFSTAGPPECAEAASGDSLFVPRPKSLQDAISLTNRLTKEARSVAATYAPEFEDPSVIAAKLSRVRGASPDQVPWSAVSWLRRRADVARSCVLNAAFAKRPLPLSLVPWLAEFSDREAAGEGDDDAEKSIFTPFAGSWRDEEPPMPTRLGGGTNAWDAVAVAATIELSTMSAEDKEVDLETVFVPPDGPVQEGVPPGRGELARLRPGETCPKHLHAWSTFEFAKAVLNAKSISPEGVWEKVLPALIGAKYDRHGVRGREALHEFPLADMPTDALFCKEFVASSGRKFGSSLQSGLSSAVKNDALSLMGLALSGRFDMWNHSPAMSSPYASTFVSKAGVWSFPGITGTSATGASEGLRHALRQVADACDTDFGVTGCVGAWPFPCPGEVALTEAGSSRRLTGIDGNHQMNQILTALEARHAVFPDVSIHGRGGSYGGTRERRRRFLFAFIERERSTKRSDRGANNARISRLASGGPPPQEGADQWASGEDDGKREDNGEELGVDEVDPSKFKNKDETGNTLQPWWSDGAHHWEHLTPADPGSTTGRIPADAPLLHGVMYAGERDPGRAAAEHCDLTRLYELRAPATASCFTRTTPWHQVLRAQQLVWNLFMMTSASALGNSTNGTAAFRNSGLMRSRQTTFRRSGGAALPVPPSSIISSSETMDLRNALTDGLSLSDTLGLTGSTIEQFSDSAATSEITRFITEMPLFIPTNPTTLNASLYSVLGELAGRGGDARTAGWAFHTAMRNLRSPRQWMDGAYAMSLLRLAHAMARSQSWYMSSVQLARAAGLFPSYPPARSLTSSAAQAMAEEGMEFRMAAGAHAEGHIDKADFQAIVASTAPASRLAAMDAWTDADFAELRQALYEGRLEDVGLAAQAYARIAANASSEGVTPEGLALAAGVTLRSDTEFALTDEDKAATAVCRAVSTSCLDACTSVGAEFDKSCDSHGVAAHLAAAKSLHGLFPNRTEGTSPFEGITTGTVATPVMEATMAAEAAHAVPEPIDVTFYSLLVGVRGTSELIARGLHRTQSPPEAKDTPLDMFSLYRVLQRLQRKAVAEFGGAEDIDGVLPSDHPMVQVSGLLMAAGYTHTTSTRAALFSETAHSSRFSADDVYRTIEGKGSRLLEDGTALGLSLAALETLRSGEALLGNPVYARTLYDIAKYLPDGGSAAAALSRLHVLLCAVQAADEAFGPETVAACVPRLELALLLAKAVSPRHPQTLPSEETLGFRPREAVLNVLEHVRTVMRRARASHAGSADPDPWNTSVGRASYAATLKTSAAAPESLLPPLASNRAFWLEAITRDTSIRDFQTSRIMNQYHQCLAVLAPTPSVALAAAECAVAAQLWNLNVITFVEQLMPTPGAELQFNPAELDESVSSAMAEAAESNLMMPSSAPEVWTEAILQDDPETAIGALAAAARIHSRASIRMRGQAGEGGVLGHAAAVSMYTELGRSLRFAARECFQREVTAVKARDAEGTARAHAAGMAYLHAALEAACNGAAIAANPEPNLRWPNLRAPIITPVGAEAIALALAILMEIDAGTDSDIPDRLLQALPPVSRAAALAGPSGGGARRERTSSQLQADLEGHGDGSVTVVDDSSEGMSSADVWERFEAMALRLLHRSISIPRLHRGSSTDAACDVATVALSVLFLRRVRHMCGGWPFERYNAMGSKLKRDSWKPAGDIASTGLYAECMGLGVALLPTPGGGIRGKRDSAIPVVPMNMASMLSPSFRGDEARSSLAAWLAILEPMGDLLRLATSDLSTSSDLWPTLAADIFSRETCIAAIHSPANDLEDGREVVHELFKGAVAGSTLAAWESGSEESDAVFDGEEHLRVAAGDMNPTVGASRGLLMGSGAPGSALRSHPRTFTDDKLVSGAGERLARLGMRLALGTSTLSVLIARNCRRWPHVLLPGALTVDAAMGLAGPEMAGLAGGGVFWIGPYGSKNTAASSGAGALGDAAPSWTFPGGIPMHVAVAAVRRLQNTIFSPVGRAMLSTRSGLASYKPSNIVAASLSWSAMSAAFGGRPEASVSRRTLNMSFAASIAETAPQQFSTGWVTEGFSFPTKADARAWMQERLVTATLANSLPESPEMAELATVFRAVQRAKKMRQWGVYRLDGGFHLATSSHRFQCIIRRGILPAGDSKRAALAELVLRFGGIGTNYLGGFVLGFNSDVGWALSMDEVSDGYTPTDLGERLTCFLQSCHAAAQILQRVYEGASRAEVRAMVNRLPQWLQHQPTGPTDSYPLLHKLAFHPAPARCNLIASRTILSGGPDVAMNGPMNLSLRRFALRSGMDPSMEWQKSGAFRSVMLGVPWPFEGSASLELIDMGAQNQVVGVVELVPVPHTASDRAIGALAVLSAVFNLSRFPPGLRHSIRWIGPVSSPKLCLYSELELERADIDAVSTLASALMDNRSSLMTAVMSVLQTVEEGGPLPPFIPSDGTPEAKEPEEDYGAAPWAVCPEEFGEDKLLVAKSCAPQPGVSTEIMGQEMNSRFNAVTPQKWSEMQSAALRLAKACGALLDPLGRPGVRRIPRKFNGSDLELGPESAMASLSTSITGRAMALAASAGMGEDEYSFDGIEVPCAAPGEGGMHVVFDEAGDPEFPERPIPVRGKPASFEQLGPAERARYLVTVRMFNRLVRSMLVSEQHGWARLSRCHPRLAEALWMLGEVTYQPLYQAAALYAFVESVATPANPSSEDVEAFIKKHGLTTGITADSTGFAGCGKQASLAVRKWRVGMQAAAERCLGVPVQEWLIRCVGEAIGRQVVPPKTAGGLFSVARRANQATADGVRPVFGGLIVPVMTDRVLDMLRHGRYEWTALRSMNMSFLGVMELSLAAADVHKDTAIALRAARGRFMESMATSFAAIPEVPSDDESPVDMASKASRAATTPVLPSGVLPLNTPEVALESLMGCLEMRTCLEHLLVVLGDGRPSLGIVRLREQYCGYLRDGLGTLPEMGTSPEAAAVFGQAYAGIVTLSSLFNSVLGIFGAHDPSVLSEELCDLVAECVIKNLATSQVLGLVSASLDTVPFARMVLRAFVQKEAVLLTEFAAGLDLYLNSLELPDISGADLSNTAVGMVENNVGLTSVTVRVSDYYMSSIGASSRTSMDFMFSDSRPALPMDLGTLLLQRAASIQEVSDRLPQLALAAVLGYPSAWNIAWNICYRNPHSLDKASRHSTMVRADISATAQTLFRFGGMYPLLQHLVRELRAELGVPVITHFESRQRVARIRNEYAGKTVELSPEERIAEVAALVERINRELVCARALESPTQPKADLPSWGVQVQLGMLLPAAAIGAAWGDRPICAQLMRTVNANATVAMPSMTMSSALLPTHSVAPGANTLDMLGAAEEPGKPVRVVRQFLAALAMVRRVMERPERHVGPRDKRLAAAGVPSASSIASLGTITPISRFYDEDCDTHASHDLEAALSVMSYWCMRCIAAGISSARARRDVLRHVRDPLLDVLDPTHEAIGASLFVCMSEMIQFGTGVIGGNLFPDCGLPEAVPPAIEAHIARNDFFNLAGTPMTLQPLYPMMLCERSDPPGTGAGPLSPKEMEEHQVWADKVFTSVMQALEFSAQTRGGRSVTDPVMRSMQLLINFFWCPIGDGSWQLRTAARLFNGGVVENLASFIARSEFTAFDILPAEALLHLVGWTPRLFAGEAADVCPPARVAQAIEFARLIVAPKLCLLVQGTFLPTMSGVVQHEEAFGAAYMIPVIPINDKPVLDRESDGCCQWGTRWDESTPRAPHSGELHPDSGHTYLECRLVFASLLAMLFPAPAEVRAKYPATRMPTLEELSPKADDDSHPTMLVHCRKDHEGLIAGVAPELPSEAQAAEVCEHVWQTYLAGRLVQLAVAHELELMRTDGIFSRSESSVIVKVIASVARQEIGPSLVAAAGSKDPATPWKDKDHLAHVFIETCIMIGCTAYIPLEAFGPIVNERMSNLLTLKGWTLVGADCFKAGIEAIVSGRPAEEAERILAAKFAETSA
jgi:hypothetical protein